MVTCGMAAAPGIYTNVAKVMQLLYTVYCVTCGMAAPTQLKKGTNWLSWPCILKNYPKQFLQLPPTPAPPSPLPQPHSLSPRQR